MIAVSQPSLFRPDLGDAERRALWFAPLLCADRGTCPSPTAMLQGMEAYNRAAQEVAASRGITFVDAAAAVPKTLQHFSDDVHLRAAGNAILAREIADAIERQGLIK
jgi:lysophospholipase L1-like esterase